MLFILAERLSRPVYELEENMPPDELVEWLIVLEEEAAREKKRQAEADAKSKRRR